MQIFAANHLLVPTELSTAITDGPIGGCLELAIPCRLDLGGLASLMPPCNLIIFEVKFKRPPTVIGRAKGPVALAIVSFISRALVKQGMQ